uniref:Uncharacterized protein AlNc14C7G950 n=1 Tax=Albugo laibachii Nc14 TaxID=890382 RepID=F0W1I2_9STRA|nr:conserved hypothetical protein [Albugo laibachii Nc14]|eukprot:CCA14911.1 conserved hypothetical protein [Albugo laibachii Nc14]
MKSTVTSIYKCLLRDAALLKDTPHFRLRAPLRLDQWGRGDFLSASVDNSKKRLEDFHGLEDIFASKNNSFQDIEHRTDGDASILVDRIYEIIRQGFRQNAHISDSNMIASKLDEAIRALQELSNQLLLAKCSSVSVTKGICVEATSQHVDNSSADQNLYRFAYRITITNNNEEHPYQIIGRQYTFKSVSGQRIALPRGSPGIVGCTPILFPGQTFQYTSGVEINAPLGSASGVLHTISKASHVDESEEAAFDVLVSPFSLIAPSAIRAYHNATGMV